MGDLTLREILEATGGELLGSYSELGTIVCAVETDTRRHNGSSSMFVPYIGKNIDAHDLIDVALGNGCIGCLTQKRLEHYMDDKFYVLVDNCVEAIWKITVCKRSKLHTKLICVTGSVGKTTTTGMIASVLSTKYRVFRTTDNLNDEFSCPEMITRIDDASEFAVIELGMGMHSSVSKMAKLLRPDAVVVTRVGYAHIGKTGSLEATCREKCGVEDGLADDGIVFANMDDPLIKKYPFKHKAVWFGDCESAEIGSDIGMHLKYAALAAGKVGNYYKIEKDGITRGINEYAPDPGRMDIVRLGSLTLIDSSFNASIESISLAFEMLGNSCGFRIAVIGDMLEVGNYAKELHERVGSLATHGKVDAVIAVGEHALDVARRIDRTVKCYVAATIEEAMECLSRHIPPSGECTVLVKGSHGSEVWKIAEKLRKSGESNG